MTRINVCGAEATNGDEEEIQEMVVSRAAAKDISTDAALAVELDEKHLNLNTWWMVSIWEWYELIVAGDMDVSLFAPVYNWLN